jgi:hypothetical protein
VPVEFERVALDDLGARHLGTEGRHEVPILLDGEEPARPLRQRRREPAGTRADLEHGVGGARSHRVGDAGEDARVE